MIVPQSGMSRQLFPAKMLAAQLFRLLDGQPELTVIGTHAIAAPRVGVGAHRKDG